MDTRTGEIITFGDTKQRDSFLQDKRKKGELWWLECAVEPTKAQTMNGLKGWHLCLCGSGKKFRECCRVKTPYVRKPRPPADEAKKEDKGDKI